MSVLQRSRTGAGQGFSMRRYLANMDWILLAATMGLVGFGLAMIYSATHADPGLTTPTQYVRSQSLGLILGSLALIGLSLIDFSWFSRLGKYLYWVNVALLGLTLVIGAERMGARRWIALPFFDVQTSEIGKVLLILALAAFLAEGVELRGSLRFVLKSVIYVALPTILIFLQPDLGTALVFGAIFASMLLVWGARWSHLALLGGSVIGVMTLVLRVLPRTLGVEILKPYQTERLTVFLNPGQDTSGAAYQLTQSKIAVASGMFSGKGFMEGTQTHLNFLPAHHTDFIFSVVGGGVRLSGCSGAAVALLGGHLEGVPHRRLLQIAARSLDRHRCRRSPCVPGVRERGYDPRHHAYHRHPLTLRELRQQ